MSKTIVLDDNTYAALVAALQTSPAGTPASPPPPPPPAVPAFFNPYPLRTALQTELPWDNAKGRVYSPRGLDDTNVWLLGVSVGRYGAQLYANFSGAEWIDQQTFRDLAVYRNRDGALIYTASPTVSPGFIAIPGVPAPRSFRVQLEPGERYTIAIKDHLTGQPSSRMFFELHFN